MFVATPFLVTVRKTGNRVGKENQKKMLLNFLSPPRRSANVQWLTFSAFTPETKGLQQSMPFFGKKCEKPDIGLEGIKNHKQCYRYRILANKKRL
ncbi:hypothetical protein CEXT_345421 [Caerostris extrusa]|uniref:Uncharacterized protein n=1 Tax=Caerostris extrusa TaxID=172846 RepID=A0AAV4W5Y1_CAEEX|nr:hypothetical protein CEXT_345421 [Caerostris extrusa]